MFDTICTLPLSSDLFAQAVHPTEPLLAIGLSNGQVESLKLPPVDEDVQLQKGSRRGSNGTGVVDTAWSTRRHKGSCRCLGYSLDGRSLYSAGSDGIVKAADTESGRVIGKVAIPLDSSSYTVDEVDGATVVHALSPQTLLLATDSGALHLFDLRDPAPTVDTAVKGGKQAFTGTRPAQTHHPHTDYISSLTPLPPSSASSSGFSKQWLTTGGTTLALTDLRRGVLVKSEDQEEELLSSLYVTGLAARKSSQSTGEKAFVGGSDGVITLWEKGQWDDQDERITVSREKETVDAIALLPEGVGAFGKKVAVGLGDGAVRFVRLGQNKVVGEVHHDEVEGVLSIGFDVGGRMISGGGQTIKVWEEHVDEDRDPEDWPNQVDSDDDENTIDGAVQLKRLASSDEESDKDQKEDQSSEEEAEKPRKRRKKRKRGKGPAAPSNFSFAGLD